MKHAWTADFEVDADQAMRLIKRIFPELRIESLERLGTGWDNSAYLADGKIVFRFPRRSLAAGLMNTEMITLPNLAPHLPLPVPVPTLIGPPTSAYPYPFSGHDFIPGVTACSVDLTIEERCNIAPALANFLRDLHNIEVTPDDLKFAPRDEIGRTDFTKRLVLLNQRLDKPEAALRFEEFDIAEIRQTAEELARTPLSDTPASWVHGDLYARHLLVDEQRRLCGVIDWGDVHLGDSALDLSIIYSFLPQAARPAFTAAYGEIDESTLGRARFRALNYGVILIDYGWDVGNAALLTAGKYALEKALNIKK